MDFKSTVFVVEINKQEFKFAAMTMRDMEQMLAAEKSAGDNPDALKKANMEMLANAMRKAGEDVTAEQVAESMPIPVYRALLAAFLTSQGVKLEAKSTGEVSLS